MIRTSNIARIRARQSCIALLALFAALAARGQPGRPLPLGNNELLVYRVSWLLVPAGTIRISAHSAVGPHGARLLRVDTVTATRGLAHLLLPFQARAESLFELSDGRLLSLTEESEKRGVSSAHSVLFDYSRHAAIYTSAEPQSDRRILPMPLGYPSDLITCLLEARTWNLQPGQARDALVLFEDEFYQLTVHAVGYDTVTTPLGTFDTLVLEPRMEKTPPLGMFKRGSTVKVWIDRDSSRLPVRFQVAFKIGAAVANLAEYEPPGPPGP